MQASSYMCLAAVFFALMGASVKWLAHLPFYEMVLFRSLIIFFLCLPQLLFAKHKIFGKKANRKILLMRGIFGTLGLNLYFFTLQKLDFGTAVTLQYTSPLFTMLIAQLCLGEKTSRNLPLLMIVSLLGVAIIYRFDFNKLEWLTVSYGLLAAFFGGCAYNCISAIKKKEHSQVIMLYFPLVTIPAVLVPCLQHFVVPTLEEALLILFMGVCTYLAQLFLTKAYQQALASHVALYSHINVIFALIIGTLLFAETLDIYKIAGCGLILLCVSLAQRNSFS